MRATVLVRPKEGILDPQGQAVGSALGHLGFEVGSARVGKVIDLEVDAPDEAADACVGDVEAEVAERALDRLPLRVEDPRLRPHEHGCSHPSTTFGSATYTSNDRPVSRSNASM